MHLLHVVSQFLQPETHGVVLAIPPLLIAAIMAAAGLAKGLGPDKDKENADKNLAAVQTRYSPWTGIKPQSIQRADPFGSMLQGGMAGLSMTNMGGMGGGGGTPVNTSASQYAPLNVEAPQFGSSAPGYNKNPWG